MNNKAQLVGAGVLITIFVAVIVGLVILQPIASNVEQGTQAITGATTATNALYTGVLNTDVELTGQELVSVTSVTNRSTGDVIPAANYTISECIRDSDGLKGICYRATSAEGTGSGVGLVNITYVYYPSGYIDSQAGRSMFSLVIVLAAIALVAFVLFFVVRNIKGM